MYFFIEQINELRSRVENSFNEEGNEIFNDLCDSANNDLYEKLNLPAIHLWGEGYCKGDAGNDELKNIADELNADFSIDEEGEIDTDLFEILDREFISILSNKVENKISSSEK